jgi:hypothetical protein
MSHGSSKMQGLKVIRFQIHIVGPVDREQHDDSYHIDSAIDDFSKNLN